MAVSKVASTRSPTSFPAAANNTSTCAIDKPTGTTTDDLMIAFISCGLADITAPAGWTQLSTVTNTNDNQTSGVYYKFATASEGTSYTFTDSSGDTTPLCGLIITYRGVDRTNPFNTFSNNTAGATDPFSSPSVTTTTYRCWILHYRFVDQTVQVATETTFSGTGLTLDQRTSNRGNAHEYVAELYDSNGSVAPGSQAGVSFTSSDTPSGSIVHTIAIQEAARFGTESGSALEAATVRATAVGADTWANSSETGIVDPQAGDSANAAHSANVAAIASDSAVGDSNAGTVVKDGIPSKYGSDKITSADVAVTTMPINDTIATTVEIAFVAIQGPLTTGHRIIQISDDPGGITIVE